MKKGWFDGMAAAAVLMASGAAHAGGVNWSVGIAVPPVQTVIGSGPVFAAPPRYYGPPAYYYAPPAYYYAPPAYYYAPPVVYAPVYHASYRYYYGAPVVVYRAPYAGYRHDRWRGARGYGRSGYRHGWR